MEARRVLLTVIDGLGVGGAPDAAEYGDGGSNTFRTLLEAEVRLPVLERLGLRRAAGLGSPWEEPAGLCARQRERSQGKDTLVGHWEICGAVTTTPFPLFPQGFPASFLRDLEAAWGRSILGNRAASGTRIIQELGPLHCKTGSPIVYTSGDSVLQIAAHEEVLPPAELCRLCQTARELLQGELGVGRVVARPFTGRDGAYVRTSNRRDFCLPPPRNLLDLLGQAEVPVTAIGKIGNIFSGRAITRSLHTNGNAQGLRLQARELEAMERGLIFTNLVDTDTLWGHRRDVRGYCRAMEEIDAALGALMAALGPGDLLMVTGDHGCDPGYPGCGHTREETPLLIWGPGLPVQGDLGELDSFGNIAATVAGAFGCDYALAGQNLLGR